MNDHSPFRKTTTKYVTGRGHAGWVRIWVYLGIVAALGFGAYHSLVHSSAGDSTTASTLASVAEPAPAGQRDTAGRYSAPLPCPYCNQDPDFWMSLTGVAPPQIGGKAIALIEASCGKLIYGVAQHERLPPASLTKIATALVTVSSTKLNDRVPITINGWDLAAEDDSSIMGLEAGMELSIEELLHGLILPSGNDAALALAEHGGGVSRFVQKMNQRVQQLGLKNTNFVNPDGRDSVDHYSSALDMALLGRELLANPDLRRIAGTQTFKPDWNGRMLWNSSYFIYNYPGATGVKLGYTELANYTIVSSAQRDGRELIVAVMNSVFFYSDSARLLDWAFANTKPACPA